MGIVSWIIFGFIVGVIARWVVPGAAPGGCIMDIIVGILGGFIGGWIFQYFGHPGVTGFWNWHSWLAAIVGAVVLLWIMRAIAGRRRAL